VLCKLDLEKAYDYVNWEFLSYLLGCLGLGSIWRKWISAYISTSRFSILINGSPRGLFAASIKRTSFCLSFFVIIMEALSRMLSKAMIRGYLSGFRVDLHNAAPLEIPHFLFQMTILFCDVDRDPFLNLGHILLCFEAILGLKATLENQN